MASLNSQTQLHNSISQYQDALVGVVNALAKNVTLQGSCKDWESLPSISSDLGDCWWIHETNEMAVWNGTHWVRMVATLDPGLLPEWQEYPEVLHSPENPFHQKTEEEKLDELADALTLLSIS